MKLEIDIDEDYYKIIRKRVEENKPYHSPYEYEVIADGKPLEQEPTSFQWCNSCKEYDQEKHCCHRWSKVIRDTVEEMKQEQEPVIDKIRAEIDKARFIDKDTRICKNALASGLEVAMQIIDKYRAESEDK